MMASYFQNPANGYVAKAVGEAPALWTLLLGPVFLGYKGLWGHAALAFVLAVPTLFISWLVYPFLVATLLRRSYVERGWHPVTADGRRLTMLEAGMSHVSTTAPAKVPAHERAGDRANA
jgi:hypothetical protein